jgi:hypothetical protein
MGIAGGTLEDRYGWLTPVPPGKRSTATRGQSSRVKVGNLSASSI